MQVKIKKLHPDAVVPKYAKSGDAGLDLVAISKNKSFDRITYGFGLAFEIPENHFMIIIPRSSIYQKDLYLTNHCGIIDSQYRGEVKAIFRVHQNPKYESILEEYNIGDRVAQAIILPYPSIEFEEVEELSSTERDTGGFGSTGQ